MKRATWVFALILTSTIVAANIGLAQPLLHVLHEVPFADKLCHFLVIGILTVLVIVSTSRLQAGNPVFVGLATMSALIVLATLEEVSQMAFPHRTFSYTDLLANYAGILLFGALTIVRTSRRTRTVDQKAASTPVSN